MRRALIALLVLAGEARADSVRHVPVAEAAAGEAIVIPAEVDRAFESTVTLHFRPAVGAWSTGASCTRCTSCRTDQPP